MSLSTNILSGNTIYSGNTNLSDIFQIKTSELVEVDYYWIGKTGNDIAINSGGTKAIVTCSNNTIEIIDITGFTQLTAYTVTSGNYVRYCPASNEFLVQKTTGDIFYRISVSGNNLIGTAATYSEYAVGLAFDCDDTYVYNGILSGGTGGICRHKQTDLTDVKFFPLAGSIDKMIKTFNRDEVWYFAAASTYGYAIYDSDVNLVCNLSSLLSPYTARSISVSPNGNYAGITKFYSGDPPKFQVVDISNFASPSLIISLNKQYIGSLFLEEDFFIWNTVNTSGNYGYDGRIMFSDYDMSNLKMYPGVYRNLLYTSQIIKNNGFYYLLFSSADTNVGTHIKKFKIT